MVADDVLRLNGGIVLHEPLTQLRSKPERLLKVLLIREPVLANLYLYVSRAVIIAAL